MSSNVTVFDGEREVPYTRDGEVDAFSGAEPIGVDILFDLRNGDIGTRSGDIRTTSGPESMRQWVLLCISTPRGESPMFSTIHGSTLRDRGRDMVDPVHELPVVISDAIGTHDRVARVDVGDVTDRGGDLWSVPFTVIMDDGSEIEFPDAEVAL